MPVSKANAEAAVKALAALSWHSFSSKMDQNKHLFEQKHLSKKGALESAGANKVGYFKKHVKLSKVASIPGFNNLAPKLKAKVMKDLDFELSSGGGVPKHKQAKVKSYEPEYNTAIRWGDDLCRLLNDGLAQPGECYQSADAPEARFVFVTPVPDGYVGRFVRGGDTHGTKDADHMFVVIAAGANPQVITAYPSNNDSVAALTELV